MVRDNPQDGSGFSTGASVDQVTEGGAAETAGIRAGDVVIEFAGQKVTSAADLTAMVRAQPAGAEVDVTVLRDGETIRLRATLGDADDLN
jgi:putative serine protease PepD